MKMPLTLEQQKWLKSKGVMEVSHTPKESPPNSQCWCGVKNPYYEPLPTRCGGYGVIECFCGGDICVCHNHGEVECFGCVDCAGEEDCEYCEDYE